MTGPGPLEHVRIGLVGGGFMARTHTLGYQAVRVLFGDGLPTIEQIRIADVSRELATAAGSRLGWRDATDDWREVTRADDVDLVDIVTPNHLHAEIAIDAARHGKHVLCEKPLAHTLDAALAMERAVREAEVINQVGYVFRLWPAMQLAKSLIDEGRLGRIQHFRAHYFHDYALDPGFDGGWRMQRELAGGGSIADIGSHVIDLAHCFVGGVARVCSRSRTVYSERPDAATGAPRAIDVDDMTSALLEFENGATGVVETSWLAAGYKTDLAFGLSGDEGALEFTWRRNGELLFYSHRDEEHARGFRTIITGPAHPGAQGFWPVAGQGLGYGDAFVILAANLLRALRAGTAASPSFADGARVAHVVDALVASSGANAWIRLASSSPESSGAGF